MLDALMRNNPTYRIYTTNRLSNTIVGNAFFDAYNKTHKREVMFGK
jgi:hypothetical protein